MILEINKGDVVINIQHQFNMFYPFLKIRFVKMPENKMMREDEIFTWQLRNKMVAIKITPQTTVMELEREFAEKTNAEIKVYRRFCNVWIETSLTADWTLDQQNLEGELLSELNKEIA